MTPNSRKVSQAIKRTVRRESTAWRSVQEPADTGRGRWMQRPSIDLAAPISLGASRFNFTAYPKMTTLPEAKDGSRKIFRAAPRFPATIRGSGGKDRLLYTSMDQSRKGRNWARATRPSQFFG